MTEARLGTIPLASADSAPATRARCPKLSNEDLLPVEKQSWTAYNLFAMWMSNVHSVAGYVFAASLFTLGIPG